MLQRVISSSTSSINISPIIFLNQYCCSDSFSTDKLIFFYKTTKLATKSYIVSN